MSDREGVNEQSEAVSAPIPLLLAAWLLPGVGHLILGKRIRAAVFAAVIVAAFATGVLLDGELAMPRKGSPFSWLATFACVGDGVLYLLGKLLSWGQGPPSAPGFAYGNTFLITAGLMNLLVVLDVSDLFCGRKD